MLADDPEAVDDLVYPIPPSVEVVNLAQNYDTSRTTGRRVRCGACAHHQWHNRGFVAELSDGRKALIGINCGEKHFGGDGQWQSMTAQLTRRQDQAYLATRIAPVREKIEVCYALLRDWSAPPTLRAYIERGLPDFDERIVEACQRNEGYLDSHKRQPRIVSGKYEIETVRHGKVPSPSGYVTGGGEHQAQRAMKELRAANQLLLRIDDVRSWRMAFEHLGKGRKHAQDALAAALETVKNWHLPWLQQACAFYEAVTGEGLDLRGRALIPRGGGWLGDQPCHIPDLKGTVTPVERALAEWPRET